MNMSGQCPITMIMLRANTARGSRGNSFGTGRDHLIRVEKSPCKHEHEHEHEHEQCICKKLSGINLTVQASGQSVSPLTILLFDTLDSRKATAQNKSIVTAGTSNEGSADATGILGRVQVIEHVHGIQVKMRMRLAYDVTRSVSLVQRIRLGFAHFRTDWAQHDAWWQGGETFLQVTINFYHVKVICIKFSVSFQ
jgi:hypothetical protein